MHQQKERVEVPYVNKSNTFVITPEEKKASDNIIKNLQSVITPPRPIHFGVGGGYYLEATEWGAPSPHLISVLSRLHSATCGIYADVRNFDDSCNDTGQLWNAIFLHILQQTWKNAIHSKKGKTR